MHGGIQTADGAQQTHVVGKTLADVRFEPGAQLAIPGDQQQQFGIDLGDGVGEVG